MAITEAPWRLTVDPAAPGPWNMSVDEALLEGGVANTVRVYAWSRSTLSYGTFQDHADFTGVPEGWDRVRRLTGGGAIAHDHELTFSLSGPDDDPLLADTGQLYHRVHEAWRRALQEQLGVTTRFRGGAREKPETVWCFVGGDPLDLVAPDGAKLIGSAQRRTGGRVLLHGSLPLAASPLMGGTGLKELSGRPWTPETAWEALGAAWIDALGLSVRPGGLSAPETALAHDLERRRYDTSEWLESGPRRLRHSHPSPKLNVRNEFR